MPLEKELKKYNEELSNLLSQEGKFVLIHDHEIVDVFDTYEDALKVGYERFNLEPFLVKQIHAVEQVQYVTRFLDTPCRT